MEEITEYVCAWQEADGRHSLRFPSFQEAKECCDMYWAGGYDACVSAFECGTMKRIYPTHA